MSDKKEIRDKLWKDIWNVIGGNYSQDILSCLIGILAVIGQEALNEGIDKEVYLNQIKENIRDLIGNMKREGSDG